MPSLMRAYDAFLLFLGMLSGLLVLLITLGIGFDVTLRSISGQGLPWLIDLAEYALLFMTFLGAPWVLRRGGHVAVEIAVMYLPERVRDGLRRVVCFLGAIICAVMTWAAVLATYEAYERKALIFKALVFPEWWILVVIPFSLALCVIEFFRQAVVPTEDAILIVENEAITS